MCVAALCGCVKTSQPVGEPRLLVSDTSGTVLHRSPDGIVTRDAMLQLTLDPLEPVQTDGFLLPLISSDGARVAWQSQSNADWPTLLAQPDATTALRASVSGKSIASGGGWTQTESLLLGRMTTVNGIVVEAPQANGSRWIGLLAWDGSATEWFVKDVNVNAFAAIGPRGELAWCRRASAATEFDLVVQRPEGQLEWPRREGESWMMPVVAKDGVYACSLRDGILELAFLPLRAGESLSRSEAEPAILRQRISIRGTARNAFQSFVACTPDRAVTSQGLLFYHPDLRRMVIWNARNGSMTLLAEGSLAAWMQPDASVMLSLAQRLVMQEVPPDAGMAPVELIPGLWIVRGRDANGAIVVGPRSEGCQISRLRIGAAEVK